MFVWLLNIPKLNNKTPKMEVIVKFAISIKLSATFNLRQISFRLTGLKVDKIQS